MPISAPERWSAPSRLFLTIIMPEMANPAGQRIDPIVLIHDAKLEAPRSFVAAIEIDANNKIVSNVAICFFT